MNDLSCLLDMHKDAYGFRPSSEYIRNVAAMSEAEQNAELDYLQNAIVESIDAERAGEVRAAAAFEADMAKLQADHGIDRATAIRWDAQALDCENDEPDYHCYLRGLKYGYLGR
jgi:hypothetical protein